MNIEKHSVMSAGVWSDVVSPADTPTVPNALNASYMLSMTDNCTPYAASVAQIMRACAKDPRKHAVVTTAARFIVLVLIVSLPTTTSSRPRNTDANNIIITKMVVVFTPPPVDAGHAPTNISTIVATFAPSVRFA